MRVRTPGRQKKQNHLYRGVRLTGSRSRQPGEGSGTIVSVDGGLLPMTARSEMLAPDGYEWGNERDGVGLAHALLTYEFGGEIAEQMYQVGARTLVAHFPDTGLNGTAWTITSAQLRAWFDEQLRAAG